MRLSALDGPHLVTELRPVKRTSWTHVSTFWERFNKAIDKHGWILAADYVPCG